MPNEADRSLMAIEADEVLKDLDEDLAQLEPADAKVFLYFIHRGLAQRLAERGVVVD
jgi:hypothetical protein